MTESKNNLHVIKGGGRPAMSDEEIRLEVFKTVWPDMCGDVVKHCKSGKTADAFHCLVPLLTVILTFSQLIKSGSIEK